MSLELVGAHVPSEVKTALLLEAKKLSRPVSSIINNLLVAYLEANGHEFVGSAEIFQPAAGVLVLGVCNPWESVLSVRCAGQAELYRATLTEDGTLQRVEVKR